MKKIFFILICSATFSCTYEKGQELVADTGYPAEVANILVNKCATEGCHNSVSRSSSGGLDFSNWNIMFEGGNNGTSVIPYSTKNSFMLYTVNTDTLRGPVLAPTMPYQQQPLSTSEYQTLYDWIQQGAPDKNGFVKFSDDPNRKKIYICMQGCDRVAVIDAQTKVIMRYIDVGLDPLAIESPHLIRVSPDGNYWYVVFASGAYLQKFRTSDDGLVSSLNIGSGNWNTIMITPDGHKGFVNATLEQQTAVVNLDDMVLEWTKSYDYPHGGFITPDGHFLYLTSQNGNFISKIDLSTDPFYDVDSYVVMQPGNQHSTSSTLQNPHEAMLSPDGSKYFVSCSHTNEVRVFRTSDDAFLATIPVGVFPQEFDVSSTMPYIFVTCTEDPIDANRKGAVYVINYNDLTVVDTIYTGYQPHGLAVDDEEKLVYVANLNYDNNGPAPHHVSECGNRNGYLTIIDMNTMQLYNKTQSDGETFQYKNELLAFPYFVSLRK